VWTTCAHEGHIVHQKPHLPIKTVVPVELMDPMLARKVKLRRAKVVQKEDFVKQVRIL